MGDFVAFSEEIDNGMEFLEHHGILGQRWGKLNGPPYPLGLGRHSAGEKSAAKAAGVKVGKSSGKGSIDNVKKGSKPEVKILQGSSKKEMTAEERRQAALDAVRTGDKKKIAKYVDQLSTDELRDAQARSQMKESLTKEEIQSAQKKSKEDLAKEEAIRSGDKEKVRQFADKMSKSELQEAIEKIDMMQKLNYEPPPPTVMDKIKKTAEAMGTFKDVAEKGINAYNVVAKVYNATQKDPNSKWPIVGEKEKEAAKEVAKEVKKDYQEEAKEKLDHRKIDYEMDKEFNQWKDKQEKKSDKTDKELNQKLKEKEQEESQSQPKPVTETPAYNNVKNNRMSDYDNVPSYDDLIPDSVRDVMNRKVS